MAARGKLRGQLGGLSGDGGVSTEGPIAVA